MASLQAGLLMPGPLARFARAYRAGAEGAALHAADER